MRANCIHFSNLPVPPVHVPILPPETVLQALPYVQAALFIAFLAAASVRDIKTRLIPDWLPLCIALTSLLVFHLINLWGVLVGLLFLLVSVLLGGIGGGDVKLMLAAGLVLGLPGAAAAAVMGLAVMVLYYLGSKMAAHLRGREASKRLPLAPFLSVGCIAAYFMFKGGLII